MSCFIKFRKDKRIDGKTKVDGRKEDSEELELLAMNMDEKGFKTSLEHSLKHETIRNYVTSVKKFEKWLFEHKGKRLEDADKGDFRTYAVYLQSKKYAISTVSTYFIGIEQYYRWWRKLKKAKAINEIRRNLPRPQPTLPLLSWNEFEDIVEKAKEEGISKEKLALLNLLWSETTPKEIVGLHKSDIDFEKRLISTPSGKTYRVTQQAWDALQEFVPNRGEKLFTLGIRSLQILSKNFVKQTPKQLRKSCKRDLFDTGKKVRFVYEPGKTTSLKEEKKPEEKKEETKKRNLFGRLVQEIKKFGESKWIHYQIPKLKNEKELQRLLEGYLLATFPDELITHEFPFKGYENTDSKIDITVGKDPKIPIEIKLAEKKIRDHKGKGLEQVREFLDKHPKSKKGILVIGDKKRDPERIRKHSGTQDSVCIIMI